MQPLYLSNGNKHHTYGQTQGQTQAQTQGQSSERYRDTNRELIKHIYSTIDISQFKFELIKYGEQLNKFISNTYFISPNYNGKNCLLVFTKIKTKYYSFLIDRKQLSYSFDKINFNEVFIHHCNVDVDLSIYDGSGSIFDGIHVRKGTENEFIITDIYNFKGINYTGFKLKLKLFELEMYLNNININIREKLSAKTNIHLKINKIDDITNIRNFITSTLKDYEKEYQVRGICFYPEFSGTKLIYLFDSYTKPAIDHVPKDTEHQSDIESSVSAGHDKMKKAKGLVKKVYTAKTKGPIYGILEMHATKTADNYKMYALDTDTDSKGKNIYKKCQMDIAYIPDMKKSQWCKDITTKTHKGTVFVKCIWRDDKKKWEPLELKDVKLPSLMEDIRKNIIEMEESDSDSDVE